MADKDFQINIRTTADTTGVKQTEAELARLKQETGVSPGVLAARQASLAGQFPQGLPAEEAEEISAATTKASKAAEELAAASLLSGANLGKARQEALVLARELATGGNVTRTLGSLLGALGPALTAASIGGLLIFEMIKRSREESEKLIADTAKLGEEFEKSAVKAQTAVSGARTSGDISHVAEEVLPELEKLHARANELQGKTINFWQKQMEDFREGIIQMSPTVTDAMRQWAHPFTMELREAQNQAQDTAAFADREAKHRIERAQDFSRQFEGLKDLPFDEAAGKLNDKIKEQTNLQNNLNKEGEDYVRSWLAAQAIIDRAKHDLQELTKYHEDAGKAADKAADGASAQVKAILANEAAARKARAEGHGRDAELFEKSAKDFEAGIHSPQDAAQLAEIRRLQQLANPTPPNIPGGRKAGVGEDQERVNEIERNRIEFERQRRGEPPPSQAGSVQGAQAPPAQPQPSDLPSALNALTTTTNRLVEQGEKSKAGTQQGSPDIVAAIKENTGLLRQQIQQWS